VAARVRVEAIYAAFPAHLRPAVLLGAFAGMRTAEVVGLRIQHVDLLRFYISPQHQNDGEELKSSTIETPIAISRSWPVT
jgi:integrase